MSDAGASGERDRFGSLDVATAVHEPTPLGVALTLLAGVVAAGPLVVAGSAFLAGLAAVLLATVAVLRGSRRLLGAAVVLQFVGVLSAGVAGLPVAVPLVAAAGTVLTWDLGEHAIGVAEQLGRRAATRRLELVHAGGSAALAALGAGALYAAFRATRGGGSVTVLVLLLLGAVVALSTLDR